MTVCVTGVYERQEGREGDLNSVHQQLRTVTASFTKGTQEASRESKLRVVQNDERGKGGNGAASPVTARGTAGFRSWQLTSCSHTAARCAEGAASLMTALTTPQLPLQ